MGTVRSVLLAVALMAGAPAETRPRIDPVAQWGPIVADASARFGIPVDWIERVIRSESGGLTMIDGRPIRSSVGAIGLMQLMPATWATMRAAYHLGSNPDDPHDNIIAGTAFLRLMQDRFGYPGMFAAYSAGPARYAAYLTGRSRLPSETIAYVSRLTGARSNIVVTAGTPPRQLLFALRHDIGEQDQPSTDRPAGDGMFAIRKGIP